MSHKLLTDALRIMEKFSKVLDGYRRPEEPYDEDNHTQPLADDNYISVYEADIRVKDFREMQDLARRIKEYLL